VTNDQVIVGSRTKNFLFLLLGLVLTVGGLVAALDDNDVAAWGATAFFGLCDLIFLFQLIRPPTLTLGREGFRYSGMGRSWDVAWEDIERFQVWKNPVPISMQRLVSWTYKDGRRPTGAMAEISAGLGAEGAIPGLMSLSTDKLVILMNQRLEASRS